MSERKFKVILADDEAPARKKMERLLGKFDELEVIDVAENGKAALESIQKHQPDIAFLDIEMPGMTGLEVAEALGDDSPTHIVFATAYNEHAIKAFELNAVDYLLKPFNEERLSATMERILASTQVDEEDSEEESEELSPEEKIKLPFANKIPIPTYDRYLLVEFDEVALIEVEDRNTILHVGEKNYIMNQTLDYFEQKLPSELFLRVNRSSLIGLTHVKEIVIWFGNRFKIILSNGKEVVSSREKSKLLKRVLKF